MSEDAETLAREFAEALGRSEQCADTAATWARQAEYHEPVNRAPRVIAAGAVYAAGLVTTEKVTQQAVADETDTSRVAIRNSYQEILRYVDDAPPLRQELDARETRAGGALLARLREVVRR